MHEAKTNLSKLVAALEAHEVDEVEIARAGHVVARIVLAASREAREPGAWVGRVTLRPDFDLLPPELEAAFDGRAE